MMRWHDMVHHSWSSLDLDRRHSELLSLMLTADDVPQLGNVFFPFSTLLTSDHSAVVDRTKFRMEYFYEVIYTLFLIAAT